jgi:tetratricopeptide (TPR) repeat protein
VVRSPGRSPRLRAHLATALLLAAACGSPEERFSDRVARADRLAAEGNPQGAILELQNALKLEPENAEIYERIGDLFRAQSRFEEALSYYREAFRLDPKRISAAMYEARLLAFSDPKRAEELIAQGQREAPDLPLVHATASQLALAHSDTGRALEEAQRAVDLGPEDQGAWVQLGTVHQARIRERQQRGRRPTQEMFESAIAAFERVDQLADGHVRAQVERARTLGVWGRRDEAAAAYKAAIELAVRRKNPVDTVAAATALDDYARELHDNDLRRHALHAIVTAKDDDYPAWERLARLVGGQRDHSEDEVYRELLARRPDDPQAHAIFVAHLLREQRDDEAASHLETLISERLDEPSLWDQLLSVRIGQGRYGDARSVLERMEKAHPDDRNTRLAQARLAIAEGRYAEAIPVLDALIEKQGEFEALRLLALARHRSGDGKGARAAMDRALALQKQPPLAALRLDAQIDHATGDFSGVLRDLQIVAGRGEDLGAEERVLGAVALYETGRPQVGRRVLEEVLAEPGPPSEAALEFARLEGKRDPERAHRVLVDAQARSPRAFGVLEALTRLEVSRGEAAAARARLDAIVASGRAVPRTLVLRAEVARGMGDLDAAEADLLRAFEANPELPGVVDPLFDVYRAQGKLAQAQSSFEQADAAGVLHPGARVILARLYRASGDDARAQALLEQALREKPHLVEGCRDLALLLAEAGGDLARARDLAQKADAIAGPRSDTVDAIGFVQLQSGDAETGLQNFRRALQLAAQRPDGHEGRYLYHSGLAMRALGRETAALLAFRQALLAGEFPEADAARREIEAANKGARTSRAS